MGLGPKGLRDVSRNQKNVSSEDQREFTNNCRNQRGGGWAIDVFCNREPQADSTADWGTFVQRQLPKYSQQTCGNVVNFLILCIIWFGFFGL